MFLQMFSLLLASILIGQTSTMSTSLDAVVQMGSLYVSVFKVLEDIVLQSFLSRGRL